MSVIEVKGVSHIYNKGLPDQITAIRDINLSVNKGEIVGIIGKTGSGKSTFVQMLNGLIKPTTGEIKINGKDIIKYMKKRKSDIFLDVGLVFQYPEYQLFEETVYKDIAFGPLNKGFSEDEVKERVYESIKFVGLNECILKRSPFELSGGEKRKVAIAGIIAMDPSILVLDEPTAGLDPIGREELMRNIMRYHEERKNTILFISHIMEDVANISDRVLVINNGEVLFYDTPREVFSKVNKLKEIGLNVPQVTNIVGFIKEKGYNVDSKSITLDQAEKSILKLLKGRKEI